MREVLLHGGVDEAFDRSVQFARRLAESLGARLHVLYTVEDPLSAGWTAEMSAERLPELHQAIEQEARARLSRYIPEADQDRLGVEIAIGTGPAEDEIVRYTEDNHIDLAIVQAPRDDEAATGLAQALLERSTCALLVIR
jgi:nucleotide-binding universal stress UspA family protein